MQVFTVKEPDIKDFMQHLFTLDTFFDFEVRGIVIHSFTHFEISGQGEEGGHCLWEEVMPYVRNILKGKKKPRTMKIILARANPETLHPNAAALFVNIIYEEDKITCTTACSQREFELNKAVDNEWDRWILEFFQSKGVTISLQQP